MLNEQKTTEICSPFAFGLLTTSYPALFVQRVTKKDVDLQIKFPLTVRQCKKKTLVKRNAPDLGTHNYTTIMEEYAPGMYALCSTL